MLRIVITLFLLFFSTNLFAEEIKLSCKAKHSSKDLVLEEGVKEIIFEEDFLLDLSNKRLFWLSIKQNWVLNNGTKKEVHKPLVYNDLTPFNLIQYEESTSGKYFLSFGNVYINGEKYSLQQFYNLETVKIPIKKIEIYNYSVNKTTLNIMKQVRTKDFTLPAINFNCVKIG